MGIDFSRMPFPGRSFVLCGVELYTPRENSLSRDPAVSQIPPKVARNGKSLTLMESFRGTGGHFSIFSRGYLGLLVVVGRSPNRRANGFFISTMTHWSARGLFLRGFRALRGSSSGFSTYFFVPWSTEVSKSAQKSSTENHCGPQYRKKINSFFDVHKPRRWILYKSVQILIEGLLVSQYWWLHHCLPLVVPNRCLSRAELPWVVPCRFCFYWR